MIFVLRAVISLPPAYGRAWQIVYYGHMDRAGSLGSVVHH